MSPDSPVQPRDPQVPPQGHSPLTDGDGAIRPPSREISQHCIGSGGRLPPAGVASKRFANRDVELITEDGVPRELRVLSDARYADGRRKVEEVLDLRTGVSRPGVSLLELLELVANQTGIPRREQIEIQIGQERRMVAVPLRSGTTLDRMLGKALQQEPEVQITTRVNKYLWEAFSLNWTAPQWRGRRVRITFQHGTPTFATILSDTFFHPSGTPKTIAAIDCQASGLKPKSTELSVEELSVELTLQVRRRDACMPVSITTPSFKGVVLLHADGKLGGIERLLKDSLAALPSVALERSYSKTAAGNGLFGFPAPSPTSPILQGLSRTAHRERFFVEHGQITRRVYLQIAQDGSERCLLEEGKTERRSDLTLPELLALAALEPGYAERPVEMRLSVGHGWHSFRVLNAYGSGVDELIRQRVLSSPHLLVDRPPPRQVGFSIFGHGMKVPSGWVDSTIRVEFRHGIVVSVSRVVGDEVLEVRQRGAVIDRMPSDGTIGVVETLTQEAGSQREDFIGVASLLTRRLPSIRHEAKKIPASARIVLEVLTPSESEICEAAKVRLLLASVETPDEWSALSPVYAQLLPNLAGYLTTRMGVYWIAQEARQGRLTWPAHALSLGSGTGNLAAAVEELSPVLNALTLSAPRIYDLDFALGMLRHSKNPRRLLANAQEIPLASGSMGLVEISSPHRLGNGTKILEALQEASRVLALGGLLMTKVEGLMFDDRWAPALHGLGFELVVGPNSEMRLPPSVIDEMPSEVRAKVQEALRATRIMVARKVAERSVSEGEVGFVAVPPVWQEIADLQHVLRELNQSETDTATIAAAKTFDTYVARISDEAIASTIETLTRVYERFVRHVLLHSDLPKQGGLRAAPTEPPRVSALHSRVQELVTLLAGSESHPLYRYLVSMAKTGARLVEATS